jgi:queuine tRNA-ribosyltransferase
MKFTVEHTDKQSNARAGKIFTDHGIIQTPVFMPVGTSGTVKAVHIRELDEDIHTGIILGNTYHLYLRPGTEVIENAGGLHNFNGWHKPILTDSGGYQVFSLADNRKVTGNGVVFQSHIDGSRHVFTPEKVIDIQRSIGADIIMALDECPPFPSTKEYIRKSMDITHDWLKRCIVRHAETTGLYGHSQSLFPIVQGGTFKDLRIISAETISSQSADGNAIGGLSVGEPVEQMYEMTGIVCDILPKDKPRYLMGVGTPANMLESITLGIDMFDCVLPTRNGRNGMLFTREGIMNMRNEKWKSDFTPVDDHGNSFVDRAYSKAYLRHLFISREMLAAMIATLHNLGFYMWLMEEARKHILDDTFSVWKGEMTRKVKTRL